MPRAESAAPNMILTGVQQITTDASGAWQSTLQASRLHQYDARNEVHLLEPDWLSQQGTAMRHISAQSATLKAGQQWQLEHDVLVRHQPDDAPALVIRTDYLEYDTLHQLATTPAAVTIEQAERIHTEAIGMVVDFIAEEFFLHEQVRTRFWP